MPHFVTTLRCARQPSCTCVIASDNTFSAIAASSPPHTITHTHTAHSPQTRSSAPAVAVSVLAGGRAGIVLARAYREHPLRDPAVSNESRYVLWILVRVVTYSAASHYADLL